ncbi:hypothetical protein IHE44_0006945, partial [Lamprotornis superbus]
VLAFLEGIPSMPGAGISSCHQDMAVPRTGTCPLIQGEAPEPGRKDSMEDKRTNPAALRIFDALHFQAPKRDKEPQIPGSVLKGQRGQSQEQLPGTGQTLRDSRAGTQGWESSCPQLQNQNQLHTWLGSTSPPFLPHGTDRTSLTIF